MKEMISRKRLQLVLYIFRIFFVCGHEDSNNEDFSRDTMINNLNTISSADYIDYSTITEANSTNFFYQNSTVQATHILNHITNQLLIENENVFIKPALSTLVKNNTEVSLTRDTEELFTDLNNEFLKQDYISLFTLTEKEIEVSNLTVVNVSTEWILISWTALASNLSNEEVTYIVVTCNDQICDSQNVTSENFTVEHNVTSLEPCTYYNFTVSIEEWKSNGVSINHTTSTQRPSNPKHIKVEAGNYSLILQWSPPQIGAKCIQKYRVTVFPNLSTNIVEDSNITLFGLRACNLYYIYINAINKDNKDGEMATVTGTPLATARDPPVLDSQEPWPLLNSIKIPWRITKMENNNCKLISMQTICNFTGTNGYGYKPLNGEAEIKLNPDSQLAMINMTVNDLSPYTMYSCWGIITNEGGNSSLSKPIFVTTLEDVPSAPKLFITDITSSQFTFIWNKPEYLAGNLHNYEIAFTWKSLSLIPDWCDTIQFGNNNITNINGSLLKYEFLEGIPYTEYTAGIKAKSAAGWGKYSQSIVFKTLQKVPGPVSKFKYIIKKNTDNHNILDTVLSWGLPCILNGIIDAFHVSVYGTRIGYSTHSFFKEKSDFNNIHKNEIYSINLRELKAEYNYTFAVSAKVKSVNTFGVFANCSGILYPAGIPPQPDETYVKSITVDPYKARKTTTSANILLPLFPDNNGEIKYYAIMVAEEGHNSPSYTRFDISKCVWPNTSSWEEAMLKDFLIPYQVTRPKWDPYPNYVADYGHIKAVKYVIGEDSTCKEISSKTDKRLYCNGPLKPNTWYHVRMRAFTCGGYTDSPVFIIKTNAELNIAIVIGVVFGILFLGILTTMMLLVRRCSPRAVLRRFLHADMPGSPVPAPFTRKKFIIHCQQLVDNPGKLSNEFRLLQTLSVDLQMPTNTACLQVNRKKNRYSDILPYDFSRVKLEAIDNDPNTDYINASFIKGYTGEDEYIACQGPKEETTYDFWRMVDQYDVKIIIMLTQLIEKGKEKCHQYYPTIRESFTYENMMIRCSSELDFRTHTQRTLILQKENKKRNVIHLHFKDWPDHDVPEDFDSMINFCQIMRRNIMANKGFVVIHCSAGIGRTGTLIAIDILLQHLRDNRKLDVFGTVYRLRHHRINMVQQESQYAYIYNCIKQVLKNPFFLKTYKPPPVDAAYENKSSTTDDISQSDINLSNDLKTCT